MKLFPKLPLKKFSRDEKIHFLITTGIGIAIIILFQIYENTNFGEHTLNKAFDSIILKEATRSAKLGNILLQKGKKVIEELTFVDMANPYKKEGYPLLTPRDQLAKVVEAAYKGKAKVILLDILLEDRDCCHPEHDQELREVFQNMINEKASTKVVFPVRIGSDGKIKRNIFDDLIASHPNFYPAIPYMSATASDRIVRYWVPFERAKDTARVPFLWNASFLAAALAKGKEEDLKTISQQIGGKKLQEAHFIKLSDMKQIEISRHHEDLYRNRIRFFLIPQGTLTKYPGGNLFELVNDVDEVDYIAFANKVVIIGNGDPEAGDIHLTPVGYMPGMYIIGNAVNTISLGLQPSHPPTVLNVLLELILIFVAAYILSRFPTPIKKVVRGVVMIFVLGTISYYYFVKTGVLLNFLFAVAGMGFYDLAINIEGLLLKRKKA